MPIILSGAADKNFNFSDMMLGRQKKGGASFSAFLVPANPPDFQTFRHLYNDVSIRLVKVS